MGSRVVVRTVTQKGKRMPAILGLVQMHHGEMAADR